MRLHYTKGTRCKAYSPRGQHSFLGNEALQLFQNLTKLSSLFGIEKKGVRKDSSEAKGEEDVSSRVLHLRYCPAPQSFTNKEYGTHV